jgi:ribonuclease T1
MRFRFLLAWLCLLFALGACSPPSAEQPSADRNEIALSALPREAQQTYALIRRGGPFPYSKDGSTFFNREGLLPARARGHYKEYTVPTPGARDRGARRIVVGGNPRADGVFWYTEDHYRSFRRIRE